MIYDTENNPLDQQPGPLRRYTCKLEDEVYRVGFDGNYEEIPQRRSPALNILHNYSDVRCKIKSLAKEGHIQLLKQWLFQLDLLLSDLRRDGRDSELSGKYVINISLFCSHIEAVADSDMRGYIHTVRNYCEIASYTGRQRSFPGILHPLSRESLLSLGHA